METEQHIHERLRKNRKHPSHNQPQRRRLAARGQLRPCQPITNKKTGEEPPDTGGDRFFSLDASVDLLATASASALALFGSALVSGGVSGML